MGTFGKRDSGAQKEQSTEIHRIQHEKCKITDYFKRKMQTLIEKFSDGVEKRDVGPSGITTFTSDAKISKESVFSLLSDLCASNGLKFGVRDERIDADIFLDLNTSTVYIRPGSLAKAEKLFKIDPELVENGCKFAVAHELSEWNLKGKIAEGKTTVEEKEMECNKMAAQIFEDKEDIVADVIVFYALIGPGSDGEGMADEIQLGKKDLKSGFPFVNYNRVIDKINGKLCRLKRRKTAKELGLLSST